MPQQFVLKLAVPGHRAAALQRHPALQHGTRTPPQQLTSIYYDTRRQTLRKAGVVVRLGRDGPAWVQTVARHDRSLGALAPRPEWHSPYFNHFDFAAVADDELRTWLVQEKIAPHLAAIFETSFRRTGWVVEPRAGVRIEVALDRGWISSAGRREAISEVTLRLLDGDPDDLYALGLQFAQRLPLPLLATSKVERGYGLYLDSPRKAIKAGGVPIDPEDTPAAAFRLIAIDCLSQLQQNHGGAVVGDDPEYVHQMRVATRRLRAAMRMFRPVLPADFADRLVPQMRALMGVLGQTRDLDVLMAEIVDPVAAALRDEPRLTDLAGAITNRRYAARDHARNILQQPAYGQMLLTMAQMLDGPELRSPVPADGEATALLPFAERRLRRLLRRVQELAEAARIDYPPSLHELRIAIKRLRYGIEFFGHMIPGKAGTRIVKRLAGLQEELGQLNDLASAGILLMACAGSDAHLREAVTLIGGWHGPRHAALLADIPARVELIRSLRLPKMR